LVEVQCHVEVMDGEDRRDAFHGVSFAALVRRARGPCGRCGG
jgi:hypothetical protein